MSIQLRDPSEVIAGQGVHSTDLRAAIGVIVAWGVTGRLLALKLGELAVGPAGK